MNTRKMAHAYILIDRRNGSIYGVYDTKEQGIEGGDLMIRHGFEGIGHVYGEVEMPVLHLHRIEKNCIIDDVEIVWTSLSDTTKACHGDCCVNEQ